MIPYLFDLYIKFYNWIIFLGLTISRVVCGHETVDVCAHDRARYLGRVAIILILPVRVPLESQGTLRVTEDY